MTIKQSHLDELFALVAKPKNAQESEVLLYDLLTPLEIEKVAERYQIFKMLEEGVPQRKIASDLGVSIEKVTRGSKAWRRSRGGFEMA